MVRRYVLVVNCQSPRFLAAFAEARPLLVVEAFPFLIVRVCAFSWAATLGNITVKDSGAQSPTHTGPERLVKKNTTIISDVGLLLAHTSARRPADPLGFTPLFYSLASPLLKKRFLKAVWYISA